MTDRSNYGPIRRLSPPVSTDTRKPYSRTGLKGVLGTLDLNSGDVAVPPTPDSPYYPFHVETPQLEPPSQNRRSAPDGPRDIPGFPTYEQYQRIEEEYLTSLSQRKQPKALISQALFDKIFAVLQNGSEDRASTAQFRFWVRKMFVLVYPQTSFNYNAGRTPESVVLHDKRPVAIKEQLYEVLCYCHALARHGGRDKTCATLRLHYSWVPKELTAKFVKACPTCTLKRSGNPDLLSQFGHQIVPTPYAPTMSAELASLPGGPNDSPPGCLSFIVGSSGCDDGCADFAPSIFSTPNLSVYPSPTFSTGSFGPMTPSPYLPSGLFGYPAMFDPGHSSLSCVAGWDPSPLSPCVPMCIEELTTAKQRLRVNADEIIDAHSQGMQTHLPTPKMARSMCTHTRSSGNDSSSGCGCNADSFPGVAGTACPIDASNIDPLLLMGGGYTPLSLVMRTRTSASDTDTDMDPGAGSGGGGPYHLGLPSTWETPTAAGASSSSSYGSGRVQQHQPPPQLGLALGTPVMGVGTHTGGGGGYQIPPPAAAPTQVAGARSFCDRAHSELPPHSARPASPPLQSRTGPMSAATTMMFAPVPIPAAAPAPVALKMEMMDDTKFLLRGGDDVQEDDAGEEEEVEVEEEDEAEDAVVEKNLPGMGMGVDAEMYCSRLEEARWDSPEAWLVPSDSIDDDDDDEAAKAML